MPRSARTISVNLSAGTVAFFKDMDQAAAKLKTFGHEGVTNVQATSGALRVLEGNMTNNVRAAERFVANVLGLGPVLQAAFPVVGAIALGGVLVELGKKTYDFFKEVRDAGKNSVAAFREMEAPLQRANDELAIADQRLRNEIALLEGKHENTAALALLEAKKAADDLADSLDKDLKKLKETLDANVVGWYRLGTAGTRDLPPMADRFRTEQASLAAKTPSADLPAAQIDLLKKQMAEVDKAIADAKTAAAGAPAHRRSRSGDFIVPAVPGPDESQRLQQLSDTRRILSDEMSRNELTVSEAADQKKKEALDAAKANAAQGKPFDRSISEQRAALDELRGKLAAIGQDDAGQRIAKAFGDAQKEIQKVNEALKGRGPALTESQKAQDQALATAKVGIESEIQWRTKYDETTRSLDERIASTNALSAAIGKGYEATREARIQSQILQVMGPDAYNPEHAGVAAGYRRKLEEADDAESGGQTKEALKALGNQIQLERDLAAAQAQGAEVIRRVTFLAKLREMQGRMSAAAFREEAEAEAKLYNAEGETSNQKAIATLDEKIAATQRMTAAILQSAAAGRQADLENRIGAARRAGASDADIDRMRKESGADYQQELAKLTVQTARVRTLDDEIAKLQDANAMVHGRLDLELQIRDLENQRIHALAQETLGLGGARDGVRAFFIEMQADAKRAADIVFEALNSSVDRVAQNLGKLLTGQKADWAKTFQQEGEKLVEASAKSMLENGLGKLGKALGIKTDGKADGSAANPFWVRMAGAAAAPGGTGGSIPGVPHGVFQGSGGGGIFSLVSKLFGGAKAPAGGDNFDPTSLANFGGWEAEGGAVDPGYIYGVNDGQGREFFQPSTAGRIIPGDQGGDTHVHNYNIDARGADLGAHNRIMRAIEASHKAAVSTAVQAMHERSKRVPGGR